MRGRPRLAALALALFLAVPAAGCSGVSKLDLTASGRARWQRPDDVVAALDLGAGDRVADVGAGEGYFVPFLSDAVGPGGRVYAVELEPEIVEGLADRFRGDRANVEPVLAMADDPALPDGVVDVVLLVNTYHHLEDRPAYFARVRKALAPGGRVAIIEPDEELGGVLALTLDEGHKSSAGSIREEMTAAGYRPMSRFDFLPVQVFEVFAPRDDAG